jgi:hypothetical protein
VSVTFTGDVVGTDAFNAAANAVSPGQIQILSLSTGANTVTVPAISGPAGTVTPTACTLVPSVGNTVVLTLKGVSGDTGIRLHNTDPSSLALDSSVATFVINASAAAAVRALWS